MPSDAKPIRSYRSPYIIEVVTEDILRPRSILDNRYHRVQRGFAPRMPHSIQSFMFLRLTGAYRWFNNGIGRLSCSLMRSGYDPPSDGCRRACHSRKAKASARLFSTKLRAKPAGVEGSRPVDHRYGLIFNACTGPTQQTVRGYHPVDHRSVRAVLLVRVDREYMSVQ